MAEPRRPASRGGPKGRPPHGPPPAINLSLFHPPGVGPAQVVGPRLTTMSKRGVVRGSGAVWCWPTAKFLHWKPRRREPHTPDTLRTRLMTCTALVRRQKPHCPQCEGPPPQRRTGRSARFWNARAPARVWNSRTHDQHERPAQVRAGVRGPRIGRPGWCRSIRCAVARRQRR